MAQCHSNHNEVSFGLPHPIYLYWGNNMHNSHVYKYLTHLAYMNNMDDELFIDADMELMAGYDYAQYKRHMDTIEFLESIGC